jgi:transcription termination factor Rho
MAANATLPSIQEYPVTSDRSTLEGKDRAELTVIAQAMGHKVGSRMRKAQIIDLIVGADDDGDAESSANGADEAKQDRADLDSSEQSEADTDESDDSTEDESEDDRDDDSDQGDNGSSKKDRGGRTSKAERGRDGGGRNDGNKNDGNRNDGNKNDGNKNDGGQSDPEPGNKRRRRRRGRDRDELPWEGEPISVDGFLDLRSDGYGFLRVEGGIPSRDDCYVPVKMVRDFGLRSGDRIRGTSRPAARNEKNPALLTVDAVNERDPEEARNRPNFDDLVPIFPNEQLVLERATTPADLTARIVDLVAPIGKGQRGLIVAPPKAGKTTVIKEIVRSIESNNPEVRLIVLLIDERPEEVTDMKRWLKNGEVVASTFDRPTEEHITVAELVGERARRMVESGDDVCIIMDGITRLARAYNLSGRFSGRTMSGGVDAGALYPAKRLFGSARNIEDGGSLTILATALVETGSRMDEVIFEEFKGTGNMELRLSRDAAEKRMWPAVDIAASSTRHDELLMDSKSVGATTKMRRVLDAVGDEGSSRTAASLELLLDRLTNFKTNADFLSEVAKSK